MLPGLNENRCFQITPNDPEYPRNVTNMIWMKVDRARGRKEGRIELGVIDCGRDTERHKNTEIKVTKEPNFHFKTTFMSILLQFFFIEDGDEER